MKVNGDRYTDGAGNLGSAGSDTVAIDTATGAAVVVGPLGSGFVTGLTFDTSAGPDIVAVALDAYDVAPGLCLSSCDDGGAPSQLHLVHPASGQRHLVLDLGGVAFVDSSGLSVLVSALKAAKKVSGSVVLLNLTNGVRALIELTRMHEVFQIFADQQAAIDQLSQEIAA